MSAARTLIGLAVALLGFAAGADVIVVPPGPFEGSTLDPATYLDGKRLWYHESRSLPYSGRGQIAIENVISSDPVSGNTERLLVLMRKGRNGQDLEPVALARHTTVEVPDVSSNPILIDGDSSDWAGIQPAVTDPAGDENSLFYGKPGTDLAGVYLARDDTYLYLLMTMHDGGPLTGSGEEPLHIVELQQYLLQLHTPGDIVINCSNPNGNGWRVDVSDRNGKLYKSYPPDTGHAAAGVGVVEFKVRIDHVMNPPYSPLPYFPASGYVDRGIENRFIRAYIHPGPHPNAPPVSDDNFHLTRPLIIDFWE